MWDTEIPWRSGTEPGSDLCPASQLSLDRYIDLLAQEAPHLSTGSLSTAALTSSTLNPPTMGCGARGCGCGGCAALESERAA